MPPIRVSLYEDNDKLRGLLELMIGTTDGLVMVGAYPDCRTIVTDLQQHPPDVVVMDIDMPGCSGIDGVRMVKEYDARIRVLMHTVFADDEKLFACLSNGANGYLLKKDSSTQLIAAIRDVFEGGGPLSPGIARRVLEAFHQPLRAPGVEYHITPREREILELLARGFTYRMIGLELAISTETVRRHLKNIYQKLHVQCGPEAVAKAIRERII
ncbi:DNA-binding response regulator, NarL/FixJ family, contains REC and HTH domains [Catalinimonas alkaloidigena]|uniref:DNA-binding response regulator, NarL/FixJ family, contains REC and HTH domains n=2 Tax=Catalinimonas alkaloidigena TaxID=1075417 RepID=A0A1G9SDV9_9BACT|nr:DNA-binding response regulator, NarL/FixJ family, contains REC and HTH domains [Catalinimonas alkaloidigena]